MVLDRVHTDLDCMIKDFVVNAVYMVCKNQLKYDKIKIEGTLGVTIDDGQIIFIHLTDALTVRSESNPLPNIPVESVKAKVTQTAQAINTNKDITPTDSLTEDQLKAIKQELNNSNLVGIAVPNEENEEEDNYDDIKTTVINPDPYLVNIQQEEQNTEALDNQQSEGSPYFTNFDDSKGRRSSIIPEEMDDNNYDDNFGEESNLSASDVMAILATSTEGQQVLTEYGETGSISMKTKGLIVRLLVLHTFEMKGTLTPKTSEKIKLAKAIVQAFPCLKSHGPLGHDGFFTPYTTVEYNGRKRSRPAHGSIEERLKTLRKKRNAFSLNDAAKRVLQTNLLLSS